MAPFLRDTDVVTVAPARVRDVRRGDLVLFRDANAALTLHRVIRRQHGARGETVLRTKGDALRGLDEPVPNTALLGKVVRIERADPPAVCDMGSRRWRVRNTLTALQQLGLVALRAAATRIAGRRRRG